MKARLNILVDVDVAASAKLAGINISSVCNQFLKDYLKANIENCDEATIIEDLNEAKQEIDKQQSRVSELTAQLIQSREHHEKNKKEEFDRMLLMQETMKVNNPLRD